MIHFTKSLAVIGVAGAMALAAATPSEARSGRNAAAIGAGVAGFAIGAAVGSAAASANSGYYAASANSGYYYGQPVYGYGYSQPAYGYYSEPAYVDSYAYAPRRSYYGGDPSGYYAPAYGYSRSYRHGPAREDHLTGIGAGFID